MSNIKRLLCGVLTLFYIISSIPLMAQTTSKIQLSAKEFSLDKLIKEIENKTDYTFVFDNTIDLKQKVNIVFRPICISFEFIPIYENKRILLSDKSPVRLNVPFKSVIVPIEVPLTIILAPMRGSPDSSVILPVI